MFASVIFDGRTTVHHTARMVIVNLSTMQAEIRQNLSDLPLWRIIVLLDDAERTAGPESATAKALARVLQDRLNQERNKERRRISE